MKEKPSQVQIRKVIDISFACCYYHQYNLQSDLQSDPLGLIFHGDGITGHVLRFSIQYPEDALGEQTFYIQNTTAEAFCITLQLFLEYVL